MLGLTLLHLALLHIDRSTNPLGLESHYDFMPFYPYFLIKDIFGFLIFLLLFFYLVLFEPNLLGHPDNYIRANPLVTPPHIVPEWYFLPFYAILRAVPSKLGGVIAMGSSIGILFLLPTLDRGHFKLLTFIDRLFSLVFPRIPVGYKEIAFYKGPRFRPIFKFFFSLWVFNFILLGILGGKPVEFPYSEVSVLVSIFYFSFFLLYF